jgi:hypothetical protein
MEEALALILIVALPLLLALGLFAVSFGITTLFVKCIRIFKPNFLLRVVALTVQEEASTPKQIRLLTIDYLLIEKRKREKAYKELQQKMMGIDQPATKINSTQEWDISAIGKEVESIKKQSSTAIQNAANERKDLWALARIEGSNVDRPRFLCMRLSVRGHGLRCAFASLPPDRRVSLDLESAKRLVSILGPGVFIVPQNSAARIRLRAEQKHEKVGRKETNHETATA